MKLESLRKKYPCFVFEKYSYALKGKNLRIFFVFKIYPDIVFRPEILIENVKRAGDLDNFIFNLGMIEALSYWKATCSKEIIVKAGYLSEEQIKWWEDLIMNGMGQFFYENRIDFQKAGFLSIKSGYSGPKTALKQNSNQKGILIPIGGGKDSIVTLELLKKAGKNIRCFSLNPTEAAKKIMRIGCKNPVIVRRKVDEKLLELNRKGFLNGHTPFSAYLAFLSVLLAKIFNYKYIALSNERSSNEGNVKYLGKMINHQWSKSFEFEKKFRAYSKKYLDRGIEYFSFLRPLYEIQIARLFSRYPRYFPVFLSCNEAYKTDSGRKRPSKKWCGKCSKCLFAFAILYPFLKEKELVKIFGRNLLNDKSLLPVMEELIGKKRFKPFECVGTTKESLVALFLSWKKAKNAGKSFVLSKHLEKRFLKDYDSLEKESEKMLLSQNKQNDLSFEFKQILKRVDKT